MKVMVLKNPENKSSWYYNKIGRIFDVSDYDRNHYKLKFTKEENFIHKSNAVDVNLIKKLPFWITNKKCRCKHKGYINVCSKCGGTVE